MAREEDKVREDDRVRTPGDANDVVRMWETVTVADIVMEGEVGVSEKGKAWTERAGQWREVM
jgi:hypothetical protein